MGRKSIKENKSVYQVVREELGLTREKAGELIPGFSPERIEKLENGRVQIQPDDVMLMAEYYKAPRLRNHYCCTECPIGKIMAPRIEDKDFVQITVEMTNCLNKLMKYKDRLLEISEDNTVRPDEYEDFCEIKTMLDKMRLSIANLNVWFDEKIAVGEIDKEQ